MADNKDYKKQYHLKQMELNSLLEITEAINNNLPEKALYKIYDFTIRANLNIDKYALYVFEQDWQAKVSYGISVDLKVNGTLPPAIAELNEITTIDEIEEPFNQFKVAIPILHKTKNLAIVLATGSDTDS